MNNQLEGYKVTNATPYTEVVSTFIIKHSQTNSDDSSEPK